MDNILKQLQIAAGLGVLAAGLLPLNADAQSPQPTAPAFIREIPSSNLPKTGEIGSHAHTFLELKRPIGKALIPPKISQGIITQGTFAQTYFETPESLACVYGETANETPKGTHPGACNPTNATAVPASNGKPLAIAIVDAFDNPWAGSDLANFAYQFGYTPTLQTLSNFKVLNPSGASAPQSVDDIGWTVESSLDIEMAYAMSPGAQIYLVEAASGSLSDMLSAVEYAAAYLTQYNGGGVVSMSWGDAESDLNLGSAGIAGFESQIQGIATSNPKVTFLAASGDAPGVIYPSSSQYVVGVGGTALSRNPYTGNFEKETTWQQTGGGLSAFVQMPSYQGSVREIVGQYRGVPDIAAVADPDTGVYFYNTSACAGWCTVGGTSVATPVSAGIMSWKGMRATKTQQVLKDIYSNGSTNFRDILRGDCGPSAGFMATKGYDLCSGMGSINAEATKFVVGGSYGP